MPIIEISLMEGKPVDKIEKMLTVVSEVVSTRLEAPIETVRVLVNEMRPHQYGIGGKPYTSVVAERARLEERKE